MRIQRLHLLIEGLNSIDNSNMCICELMVKVKAGRDSDRIPGDTVSR